MASQPSSEGDINAVECFICKLITVFGGYR